MFESPPLTARSSATTELGATHAGGGTGFRTLRRTLFGSVAGKLVELPPLALIFTLVPRVLGPSRFGEFALGFFTVTLGSACVAVSGAALMSRFVGASPLRQRTIVAHDLAVDLARRRVVQIGGLGLLGVALAVSFPARFPPTFTAVVVGALAIDLLATLCFQVLLGLGRTGLWSFRYAIQNSTILASALVLTATFGPSAAVGSLLIGSIIALMIGTVAVFGPLREGRRAAAADRQHTISPDVGRFRIFKGLSNVLTQLTHRGGVILVAVLTGSNVEVGYAGLAIGTGLTATYAIWQLFTVQLPMHSEQTVHDHLGVEQSLQRFARRVQLLAVVATLAAAASLSPVLATVLGDRFLGAREAFLPALGLVPLATLTALGSQLATLRLRPAVETRATAFGAATFLAVGFIATPMWGATGVTIALLAGGGATVAGLTLGLRGAISPALAASAVASIGLVFLIGSLT